LVIFIHGFPGKFTFLSLLQVLTELDSWHVWNHFLRNQQLKDAAVLVAVDLPGYGGSDSLDKYDANNVLETMAEFIIKMREKFLVVEQQGNTRGPVVIVSHDWGATVGFRLASEAPSLADRWIISNSFHVSLTTTHTPSLC
jgi:pimeloyl-ACP methyl ester carboxylesterase